MNLRGRTFTSGKRCFTYCGDDVCNCDAHPEANAFGLDRPLPYYCPACEAVPQAGYCNLPGCPTALQQDSGEGEP